jgi:hypothetical protein
MLFLLIPLVWLACVGLLVALCRMAARGDAQLQPTPERPPRPRGEGLVVWDEPPEVVLQDRHGGRARQRARGRLTAHGVR